MNDRPSTEQALVAWRYGPIQAERMSAALLMVEGFAAVDPQCPLGGPDGLKDFLCTREGRNFVGASYFPPRAKRFRDVKRKFVRDLEGVRKNGAQGIVFLTNQRISPTERTQLAEVDTATSILVEVYHLERIRAILDTPRGYGIRAEFLRIPMSLEEQVGLAAEWRRSTDAVLREQAREFTALASRVEASFAKFDVLAQALVAARSIAPHHEGRNQAEPKRTLPREWDTARLYAAAEITKDLLDHLLSVLDVLGGEMMQACIFTAESKAEFAHMADRVSRLPLWMRNPIIEDVAARDARVGAILNAVIDLRQHFTDRVFNHLNARTTTRDGVQTAFHAAAAGLLEVRDEALPLRDAAEAIMADCLPRGTIGDA